MSCSWAKCPQELDASSEQMGWLASENLSTFRKVGRQCIFHFKISASRDDWLRFFFYSFSFACILGMEHVQPWEPGRDWKSNMIGQIHVHRVACRMEVSNFKLVFLYCFIQFQFRLNHNISLNFHSKMRSDMLYFCFSNTSNILITRAQQFRYSTSTL